MTSQQIRNTIAANERSINQYWNEKNGLWNQIDDLESLRTKFGTLQDGFALEQNRRRKRFASSVMMVVRNNIFKQYHTGMKDLLNSKTFENAYDGLTDAKNKIWQEMQTLQKRIETCDANINYLNGRNEYWRSELAKALESERGENG